MESISYALKILCSFLEDGNMFCDDINTGSHEGKLNLIFQTEMHKYSFLFIRMQKHIRIHLTLLTFSVNSLIRQYPRVQSIHLIAICLQSSIHPDFTSLLMSNVTKSLFT